MRLPCVRYWAATARSVIDSAWFEARRPRPPAGLGHAMEAAVAGARTEHGEFVHSGTDPIASADERALGSAASDLLKRAGAELGRDRSSAFALLAADGLLTYACVVALDYDDPVMAIKTLLEDASSS